MKRVLLFVLLSSVALAAAAQQPPSSSVEVRANQIMLPAQAFPVIPDQLAAFTGVYHLSNGETMYVHKAGRLMYARVGERPAKKLVASAANMFVAIDEKMRVSFDDAGNGGMDCELLMVIPRTLSSIGGAEVIRLSSR